MKAKYNNNKSYLLNYQIGDSNNNSINNNYSLKRNYSSNIFHTITKNNINKNCKNKFNRLKENAIQLIKKNIIKNNSKPNILFTVLAFLSFLTYLFVKALYSSVIFSS